MGDRSNKSRNRDRDGEDISIIDVVQVVRHDDQNIIVPNSMSWAEVRKFAERKEEEDDQIINFSETINAFPYDAAYALKLALDELFGVAIQREGFFGARMVSVETGFGETTSVPWGEFNVPGIEGGTVGCAATVEDEKLVFVLHAEVRRKYEGVVKEIAKKTREIVSEKSIYRGKAFRMKFRNDGRINFEAQPKFMDLRTVEPAIFQDDIEVEVQTNIYAPIRYAEAVRSQGINLKRGVLLAGEFGVGKTLLARNVAKVAVENGWTFLYCDDVSELTDALQFAQTYGKTVVFAEDVDRVTRGKRTADMDQISYALDGIEAKNTEIITILTTNKPAEINPMIIRAGRIDVTLFLDPPDAKAAEKLIRNYAAGRIAEQEDLTEAGKVLGGQIPAIIREVVDRSGLQAIARTGGKGDDLVCDDIVNTAKAYLKSKERLEKVADVDEADTFAKSIGAGLGGPIGDAIKSSVTEYLQTSHQNGASATAASAA